MKPVIYVTGGIRQGVTLYEYESCYVVTLSQHLDFLTESHLKALPRHASSLEHIRNDLLVLLQAL